MTAIVLALLMAPSAAAEATESWSDRWLEVLKARESADLESVPILLAATADTDMQVAWFAANSLSRVAHLLAGEQVEPLWNRYCNEKRHSDIVEDAIHAIGSVRPELVVPRLIGFLSGDDWRAQWYATGTLQRLGPLAQAAVPALTRCVREGDSRWAQSGAARALRDIGVCTPAVLAALRAGTKHTSKFVRRDCLYAITVLGGEAALPTFLEMLRSGDADNVEYVQRHSEKLGAAAKQLIPEWTKLLEDPRKGTFAAIALADLGPTAKEALPALRKQLTSVNSMHSACTAVAILAMDPKDKEALEHIVGRASTLNPISRRSGVLAAAYMPKVAPSATPAVLSRLYSAPLKLFLEGGIRLVAASGSQAASAIPVLVEITDQKDPALRGAAATALGSVGKGRAEALSALAKLLKDEVADVRVAAVDALASLGLDEQQTKAAVLKALADPSQQVRAGAVRAVGPFDPLDEMLVKCLTDPGPEVRAAAAAAIGQGGAAAASRLEVLSKLLASESGLTRVEVARAMGRIDPGSQESLAALIESLRSKESAVRMRAVAAIAERGALARPALVPLAAAARPDVTLAANQHELIHEAILKVLGGA